MAETRWYDTDTDQWELMDLREVASEFLHNKGRERDIESFAFAVLREITREASGIRMGMVSEEDEPLQVTISAEEVIKAFEMGCAMLRGYVQRYPDQFDQAPEPWNPLTPAEQLRANQLLSDFGRRIREAES